NPKTGKRRIDEAFPEELREHVRVSDMFIRFKNGSTWQVVGSDNYKCYSDDTEVLTDNGWKLFQDIGPEDLAATLDDGRLIYAKINAMVMSEYHGDMWAVRNNAIDILVTPGHRFYVKSQKGVLKFKAIDDPTIYGYKIPAQCRWSGISMAEFVVPEVEGQRGSLRFPINLWCAFLGIFLSEGATFADDNGNYRVVISQTKPGNVDKIRMLLDQMGLKARYEPEPGNFIIANKQLWDYCKQFGLQPDRFIPKEIKSLPKESLQTLADWLVLGDGWCNQNGSMGYGSTSKRLVDDVQEVFIKLGLSGNVKTYSPREGGYIRGRPILSARPFHVFYRRVSKYKYFHDSRESYISTTPYEGTVWCIDAGSHVIKVRRNGKEAWCGNSLVGSPPIGLVGSEWAKSDPGAWAYLAPILLENRGWFIVITTPEGKNHAWSFHRSCANNPAS
ncbi:MAG: hypothetical protein ACREBU_20025, partial [Nitrososphaera sp.]